MRKGYLLPKIHIMHPKAKCRQLLTVLVAGIVSLLYNITRMIFCVSLSNEDYMQHFNLFFCHLLGWIVSVTDYIFFSNKSFVHLKLRELKKS